MQTTYSLLGQFLSLSLFCVIVTALMTGYPVAFVLGGVSILFALAGAALGVFDITFFAALPSRFFTTIANPVLIAVPLFILMGVILERSNIAEVLLTTMGQAFGELRGGLAISVILVGTLLAASTGVVGATVVTMGLLSLPAMLRAGYDPKLAAGLICASGTLGQIIPPSTVLIFLADILQGANAAAAMAQGNFAPDSVSVGDLFAGALFPGLMLSGLFIVWVVIKAIFQPESCPALNMTDDERAGLGKRIVIALVPPIFLILAVLGSILGGVATTTEAGSVGVMGAILLTLVKMLADRFTAGGDAKAVETKLFWFWICFIGVLAALTVWMGALGLLAFLAASIVAGMGTALYLPETRKELIRIAPQISTSTLSITSMVFIILLGASTFSMVFSRLGGEQMVADFLKDLPGGFDGALFVVMFVMFVLGFFLDTFEIIFITVPISAPVLLQFPEISAIWLGILFAINLQTSFLTPPFGFALFYLRGVAPPAVTTQMIYRGVLPFVAIQLMVVVLVWYFPQTALWLPHELFRNELNIVPGDEIPSDTGLPDEDL
ncbi:MAG: TRAP transporter large permease subunit [Tagaea sp.]